MNINILINEKFMYLCIKIYLYYSIAQTFITTLFAATQEESIDDKLNDYVCDAYADTENISKRFSDLVIITNNNKMLIKCWICLYKFLWFRKKILINNKPYELTEIDGF